MHPFSSSFNANSWLYDGSTVLTNRFARLTPIEPNQSGWIMSSKRLPENTLEVMVEVEVVNKNSQNSDGGFAIHFLERNNDYQSFTTMFNSGPFFGIESVHKGFSVIASFLDVNMKYNPMIYVINNSDRKINKDMKDPKDYRKMRVTKSHGKSNCNVDISRLQNVKLKIRIFAEGVYVYVLSFENNKPKTRYCLDAIFDKNQKSTILGVSASTKSFGAVHDVKSIMVTHSPKKKSQKSKTDEVNLFLAKEKSKLRVLRTQNDGSGTISRIFWLCIVLAGMYLFLETIWEITLLKYLASNQIDPTVTLEVINRVIPISIAVLFIEFIVMCFTLQIISVLLLVPLFLWRMSKTARKANLLDKKDYDYTSSNRYLFWLYSSVVIYALFLCNCIAVFLSF